MLKHISKYCKVSQKYLARHLGVCQYGLKRSFEFDILPALPRDETFCTSPIPVYFIIKFHFLRGPLRRLMRVAKPLTLVMRFIFLSSYDNFLGQNFGPAGLKTGVGHKTQLFRKRVPALMHLAWRELTMILFWKAHPVILMWSEVALQGVFCNHNKYIRVPIKVYFFVGIFKYFIFILSVFKQSFNPFILFSNHFLYLINLTKPVWH